MSYSNSISLSTSCSGEGHALVGSGGANIVSRSIATREPLGGRARRRAAGRPPASRGRPWPGGCVGRMSLRAGSAELLDLADVGFSPVGVRGDSEDGGADTVAVRGGGGSSPCASTGVFRAPAPPLNQQPPGLTSCSQSQIPMTANTPPVRPYDPDRGTPLSALTSRVHSRTPPSSPTPARRRSING